MCRRLFICRRVNGRHYRHGQGDERTLPPVRHASPPGSWLVVPRVDLDGALTLEYLIELFGGFGCEVTLFETSLLSSSELAGFIVAFNEWPQLSNHL